MGCYYNCVRYLAPLNFRDLQMITCSRVLPEALDVKFKCHIDQQERAGYRCVTPRYISQGSCKYNPEDRPSFDFPFYPASWNFLESPRVWRTLLFGLLWQ